MGPILRCLSTAVVVVSFGCSGEGGCAGASEYEYPREDPAAALTLQTARLRLTQAGFDTMGAGVSGLLAATCETGSTCEIDAGGAIRFVISDPADPLTFSLITASGEIRGGAHMALSPESMAGNVHMKVIPVDAGPDGLQITLGCNEDDFSDCFPECPCDDAGTALCDPSCDCDPHCSFIEGSLDMELYVEQSAALRNTPPLGWHESVCSIRDRAPPTPGIIVQSFRFTLFPRIQVIDQRPYLVLENDDVNVDRIELAIDTGATEAVDPVCEALPENCNLCGSAGWIIDNLLEPLLESDRVAGYLATLIARSIFGNIEDKPLDMEGEVRTRDLLPGVINRRANATGYRIAVNGNSPEVTGPDDGRGMNFDVDSGFVARASTCVPRINPSWTLPPAPDPGTTVLAPDPETGVLTLETFDMALLLGDVLIERALFEMYDGGSFCLTLAPDTVSSLSGGGFVPTVDTIGLMITGLSDIAPRNAPVELWLVPRLPALIMFGTGDGEGEDRDSHVKMIWPSLNLEVYPLVDDTQMRALAFSFDLQIGVSLEATPSGDIGIVIDRLVLADVEATYNEMNIEFHSRDIEDLVGTFLPMLLTDSQINVALTTTALGLPFVPKLRAAGAADDEGRYLGMYFRFCMPDEIVNPDNVLCYEDPEKLGSSLSRGLGIERIAGPGGDLARTHIRLRAFTDNIASEHLQIAYSVDDVGPMFSFRGSEDDGSFIVDHPMLGIEGLHTITVVGRDRRMPGHWTDSMTLEVVADHRAPLLKAWRGAGGVFVEAEDAITPAERIGIRAEVDGDVSFFAVRQFVAASPQQRVVVQARDDAGNVSEPVVLGARAVAEVAFAHGQPQGCAATGSNVAIGCFMAVMLLFWRRR